MFPRPAARPKQLRPLGSPFFFLGRPDAAPSAFRTREPFSAPRRNVRWILKGEVDEGEYLAEIEGRKVTERSCEEASEEVCSQPEKQPVGQGDFKCRFWA
jgi:hypothetical protein